MTSEHSSRPRGPSDDEQSASRLHALFEQNVVGMAYHRMLYDEAGKPVDYLFLDANEAYRKITRFDPRGLTAKQAYPAMTSDPFDWVGTFANVVRTGETAYFEQYLQSNDRSYDCFGYRTGTDHFVVVFLETTERKRAERALQESEMTLEGVLNSVPQSLFWKDAHGVYLGCNQPFAEFAGASSPDEIVGKTDLDLPWAEQAEAYRIDDREVWASNAPKLHIVEPLPLAEGELIWIQTTKVPLHDHNGQPYAVLGIFEDVTERKRAEADILRLNEELAQSNRSLEEATRAKSDFLASMSHELRTPLNSIIGFSGVLAQEIPGELNAEQHKQLGMINRSGRHLLLLVNEILDLVRIESGQKNPTIRDVDISELVAEMFNTMEPLAAAKGLQVNLVRPEEPLRAITDPHFMSQIMLNLLGNAVKFTDVGHVTTTVSREGTDLLISVQDSGCGIAAENTARIFDDFYQAAASDGVKHEGTGLGLAVSRRLAESIGVQIDVVSELGKGSTFTVRIPDTVPK